MPVPKRSESEPGVIEVWECPECGYWRQEQSTGVHIVFTSSRFPGRGQETHKLRKAVYIFEGWAAPAPVHREEGKR